MKCTYVALYQLIPCALELRYNYKQPLVYIGASSEQSGLDHHRMGQRSKQLCSAHDGQYRGGQVLVRQLARKNPTRTTVILRLCIKCVYI